MEKKKKATEAGGKWKQSIPNQWPIQVLTQLNAAWHPQSISSQP